MLIRLPLLVAAVAFLKGTKSQQYDVSLPSILLNKSIAGAPQGSIIQKTLNQIASNRGLPTHLQQALQKSQISQPMVNVQTPIISQIGPTQANFIQTPLGDQRTKGYRQSLIVQEPARLQLSANPQNSNHIHVEQPNALLSSSSPGVSSTPILTPTIAPQLISGHTTSIPSGTLNPATGSVVFSPNDPSPTGVPSYIFERSNCGQTFLTPDVTFSDPTVRIIPQQNQPTIDFSQNGIAVVNSGIVSSQPTEQRRVSYVSQPSGMYSGIAQPNLARQNSRASSLKALLPLILNLIKERNNCDCCPRCGCSNKSNNERPLNNKESYNIKAELIPRRNDEDSTTIKDNSDDKKLHKNKTALSEEYDDEYSVEEYEN